MEVSPPEQLRLYRDQVDSIFTLENTLTGNQTCPVEETPGILHIHGGELTTGNRFLGVTMLDWVESLGAVFLTAEYRLAPEHPQPAALEDSYATLQWMSAHAAALGFNPHKVIVTGGSAGGNLAAGVALLAGDRSGPEIRCPLLVYPWLDDNTESLSVQQYGDIPPVTKPALIEVTDFTFGRDREYADMYTAPARASSLAGLPPTFIDMGEADVFRDQDVAYASALWRAGVTTELHVWPGSWHGFDVFAPDAAISKRATTARFEWLQKLLA